MQYKISKRWTLSLELKRTDLSSVEKTLSVQHDNVANDKPLRKIAAQLRKIGDEINDEYVGRTKPSLAEATADQLTWLFSAIKLI